MKYFRNTGRVNKAVFRECPSAEGIMKKRISVFALLSFGILLAACSGDDGATSKVTIGFEQIQLNASSAGTASSVPAEVSTLDVKVYAGSVSLANLLQSFSFNKIDLSSERISINVIPGDSRVFEFTARNVRGLTVYKGLSSSISLTSGKEEYLNIQMQEVSLTLNANLIITLVDINRNAYVNPGYLRTTDTVIAEVYKPSYTDGVYDMGAPLSTAKKGFGTAAAITEVTGAAAYPETYQLVMVRVMTLDGTIAAIGGIGVESLKEGDNQITVAMTAPGRIKFITPSTAVSVKVNMVIGGSSYTVADNGIFQNNSVIALIPNAMAEFGKDKQALASLTITYTVNGITGSKTFDKDINPLKWGEIEIKL